jgi:putative Holliday junction resolvase
VRVLCLDPGERRVGVALSDPTGTLARPLSVLERGSRKEDFAAVARLVAEHDVERVVVGYPLSLDGTEGPQGRRVRRYAEALAEALPVPLEMWDERYSTSIAEEILERNRGSKRDRDFRPWEDLDAVAAAVILQSYLDGQKRSPVGGGPESEC